MTDTFCKRYGPWALVTGASSGIGRAIANHLAQRGINLVIVARSEDVLAKLQSDWVTQYGIRVRTISIDLGAEGSTDIIRSQTHDLDIGLIVLAAGFGSAGRFHENPIIPESEMLAVNCRSPLELSRLFAPRFVARGRGGLMFLSSIVAFQGMPFAAHYAATKAYIQSFAEALAIELAPFGVDVLSVAPGPTKSNFANRAGMVMGKAADVEMVARAACDAIGRRSHVTPGGLAKLLRYSMTGLPRWIKVRMMGRVMKGMIAKPE